MTFYILICFIIFIGIRGTLHVSGDGMRVVDKETKGLVLDQTIEKVPIKYFLFMIYKL